MVRLVAISSISGMTAPIIALVLGGVASVLGPGYDQLTQKGSELGTGPNSIVTNVNFGITGLLIMVLAFGLIKNVHGSYWTRIGIIFLAISGVGEVAAAVFPCDPGCPLAGSFSQLVHTSAATVFFGSISISVLLVSFHLDRDMFWKSYRTYSTVSGLLSIVGFTVFAWAVLISFQYVGLVQRLFLIAPFHGW